MVIAFIRTIILYTVIVVSFRLMGKRQIGELETSELVTAVLISEVACIPMQDSRIPLLAGVIPVLTLLCFELLLSTAAVKSIRFRDLLCGKPSLVISEGRLLQRALIKNRLTADELAEELRKKGITDFQTVKYAILETDGKLSVIPYPDRQPLTPLDMGLKAGGGSLMTMLVSDGRVLRANMRRRGISDKTLASMLKKYGASSPKEAFILSVDENMKCYFIKKDAEA